MRAFLSDAACQAIPADWTPQTCVIEEWGDRQALAELRRLLQETEGSGQYETLATLRALDVYSVEKCSILAEALTAFVEREEEKDR